MPYFDPEPKKRREGFYDMEEELEGFVKAVERDKLIVVKGLRRYGETSLILTGLNSVGARYVLIDCRLLPEGFITIKDFASLIKAELSRRAFGGVIGWLTYFGHMYSRVGKRSVNEILDIASSLAIQELEHALSLCSLARRGMLRSSRPYPLSVRRVDLRSRGLLRRGSAAYPIPPSPTY